MPTNSIDIILDFGVSSYLLGRLVWQSRRILFEYHPDFITTKLNPSPLKVLYQTGVQNFDTTLFEGLPGFCADSLPDGWGRLLLDRALRKHGYEPNSLTVLDRLSHIGKGGMGALYFHPGQSREEDIIERVDLNLLADASADILNGLATDQLDTLLALNGSSAGARPKTMLMLDADKKHIRSIGAMQTGDEYWLVKFPNGQDGLEAGAVEYVYSQMARLAGIEMAETHLFPARKGAGYFAAKRFDRIGQNERLHMHTACGLLHSDFRVPALDYQDIIKLGILLTRDMRTAEQSYRRAVFNLLSHNRDDHGKNFAFLMDKTGQWHLSPAYDLTFSYGVGHEHSTMFAGEGRNPQMSHLMQIAKTASLQESKAKVIIEQCKDAVSRWQRLANETGISADIIASIQSKFNELNKL